MTAEVGVMNGIGVALAADSAVTMAGRNVRKIYTSADKLFQLSTGAPVAAMIYGNADYVGMPWETILKSYREELGSKVYPTIVQYAEKLLAHCSRNRRLFPVSSQQDDLRTIAIEALIHLRDHVLEHLKIESTKARLTNTTIRRTAEEVIAHDTARLRKLPYFEGGSAKLGPQLRGLLRKDLPRMIDLVFGTLPMSKKGVEGLRQLTVQALLRNRFGRGHSGLIIAGFGANEYSPALAALELEGMAFNKPRFAIRHTEKIGGRVDSFIMPFAQREMIYLFMEGIDRLFEYHVITSTQNVILGVVDGVLRSIEGHDAKFGKTLRKRVTPQLHKIVKEMFDDWKEQRAQHYARPIMRAVAALPKDELGLMAEALVSLTKFKRRVSTQEETVGGPIDVAIITKGDGFVWLKRKHYFDPILNPRVIARLTRGN